MLSIKEINLLQAQNEGLKKQNEDLQKENAELKEEIKELAHYLACMTEQRNKANTCLQEVKSIVSNIIDGYIRPYGDYEQLKKILDLITKAGSEEE